ASRTDGASEVDDDLGVDAADRGRPLGCLGLVVVAAAQVPLELVVADTASREEVPVVQTFVLQHVRERQHDGDIGVRAQRDRLCFELWGGVASQRGDRDETYSRGMGAALPLDLLGAALPTGVELGVLRRHAAE